MLMMASGGKTRWGGCAIFVPVGKGRREKKQGEREGAGGIKPTKKILIDHRNRHKRGEKIYKKKGEKKRG